MLAAEGRLLVSSTAYGCIAEHFAIAELLERGHKVAVPVSDDYGVDLIVNHRMTVQVKNAIRGSAYTGPAEYRDRYGYERLAWSCHPKGRKKGSGRRPWTEADIYMLHAHRDWFIVPRGALDGRSSTIQVYFGGQRHNRPDTIASVLEAHRNAWEVFDQIG